MDEAVASRSYRFEQSPTPRILMTVSTRPYAQTAQPARALLVDRNPDTRRIYAEYLTRSSRAIRSSFVGHAPQRFIVQADLMEFGTRK